MQQRDKFDAYYQGNLSVIDILCRLQDLADTVGDLDDSDVVLAFWRRCKPYLRAELTRAGHEPSELTSSELEVLATRIERADEVAHETRKGTSSKPVQSRGGPKRHNRDANPPQSTQSTPSNGRNMNNSSHSTKSSSHLNNRSNSSKRPRRDHPDQDKERQRIKRLREEGKCFHCESPDHMAKDCPQRHNKKPPMQVNSVAMSATEIKLAALSEGKEMGLFVLGDESHLMEYVTAEPSDEYRSSLRDVLWARASSQLYDNVPVAFDLLEGYRTDPFSPDRFTIIEYGGFDSYLLSDDHTLVTYVLTREQLIDPEFDLIHWFHIQQSENFHDMRRAPWWDTEGGTHHCTMQEDWKAYLERHCYDSSCDDSASTSELSETEVSADFEYLDAVDGYDDLPDLQSVADSALSDDRLHDFDEDEITDLDTGGFSLPIEESLDSLEGESSEQPIPAMDAPVFRWGFLLSALVPVQNAKHSTEKTEPNIHVLERNAA